ncbi:hypothetical protein GCM10009775_20530 [Microbacterium aoyamense]|uniref:Uncharacterized protein n=1 Tax=Microbacterium aoyamense TaxID=344166 RepID=A0ABP5B2I6_9MICO|nr:hypothetical protein [Microbacterium aoyamense]
MAHVVATGAGTTKMGGFVFVHSFQLPNLVCIGVAIIVGVSLSFVLS